MTNQPAHPPDRSWTITEHRNARTNGLDRVGVAGCVAMLNAEDSLVAPAVGAASGAIVAFIEAALAGFRDGGRLVYVGAGTSGRLGVLDAAECPPTFQSEPGRVVGIIAGGDAALRVSSESLEDDPDGARGELESLGIGARDSVLGIAAGGTTPYAIGAARIARSMGAVSGLLTCSPISEPNGVDHLIVVETGPEALTGSTRMKAGTATKMVLNIISTTLMAQSGKVFENLMVDLRASNNKLRDRAARIIAELTGLDRDDAFELLDAAGGNVKAAVVMRRRGVPLDEAMALLESSGGELRGALQGC
ncbi:MAG: N-acetylmuramic acid 6-phosphate etherase [Phycisphaeraceae bacterium]|nr:N-acetylmuramic acid 6-phosphate etherase [Phycisphaeraceae bacterium]